MSLAPIQIAALHLSACVGPYGYNGYGNTGYGYNKPAYYGYGYNTPFYYGTGYNGYHY